jgi:hypothetical protein
MKKMFGLNLSKARLIILCLVSIVSSSIFADVVEDESYYCSSLGGTVEEMAVNFSTISGRVVGPSRLFCIFTPDNGTIAIGLETFASDRPSIAATYIKTLAEITPDSPLFTGTYSNPSHNVCKNLGGAMVGFLMSGGFTDVKGESDICVFGDGSMVSAWSLIYMANHRNGYDEVKEQVKSEPLNISRK